MEKECVSLSLLSMNKMSDKKALAGTPSAETQLVPSNLIYNTDMYAFTVPREVTNLAAMYLI